MSTGCAFIKYKTVEEAEKAIAGLHNAKQLPGVSLTPSCPLAV
jgi:hypothetical protein